MPNRQTKFKNAKNGYATLQRYVKWCKRLYSHTLRARKIYQPLSHRRNTETGTTKCEKGSDLETAATWSFALRGSENGWINSFANVSQPGRFATLFRLVLMPIWVINRFSGFLKQRVTPILRRNENLHPVLWTPFYVAGLVVTNLPGKSEWKRCHVLWFYWRKIWYGVYPADVTHFWVDRIWTKPLSDLTFLHDTTVARQNT